MQVEISKEMYESMVDMLSNNMGLELDADPAENINTLIFGQINAVHLHHEAKLRKLKHEIRVNQAIAELTDDQQEEQEALDDAEDLKATLAAVQLERDEVLRKYKGILYNYDRKNWKKRALPSQLRQ